MKDFAVRSPGVKVGGLVYFGRMLDKIRVHAKGELPAEYHPKLGSGFDGWCVNLLQIDYGELVERVKTGGTDEEILEWFSQKGGNLRMVKFTFGMSSCGNAVGTMNSPRH